MRFSNSMQAADVCEVNFPVVYMWENFVSICGRIGAGNTSRNRSTIELGESDWSQNWCAGIEC